MAPASYLEFSTLRVFPQSFHLKGLSIHDNYMHYLAQQKTRPYTALTYSAPVRYHRICIPFHHPAPLRRPPPPADAASVEQCPRRCRGHLPVTSRDRPRAAAAEMKPPGTSHGTEPAARRGPLRHRHPDKVNRRRIHRVSVTEGLGGHERFTAPFKFGENHVKT